jgi:general secretion pathway protein G
MEEREMTSKTQGFTLIELLIVVAIIAILAAIAVPNFLEAQTRAKIARVKADMRSEITAIEAYGVDNNHYPLNYNPGTSDAWCIMPGLTTPIAYIVSIPTIPFQKGIGWEPYARGSEPMWNPPLIYRSPQYFSYEYFPDMVMPDFTWMNLVVAGGGAIPKQARRGGMLFSYGPDQMQSSAAWWGLLGGTLSAHINGVYDPTNGTTSTGDISRVFGDCDTTARIALTP